jgi:hypothetical protein
MKQEIAEILGRAKTRDWKQIKVDFGDDFPGILEFICLRCSPIIAV